MRFLLDAHIPRRLCVTLLATGHECAHVETLELGNRSSDAQIARAADEAAAVVVSKDSDFRISHQLGLPPKRLLLIAVGNMSNADLAALVSLHLPSIVDALAEPGLVELRRDRLTLSPRPRAEN